jgi:hypothetical protein
MHKSEIALAKATADLGTARRQVADLSKDLALAHEQLRKARSARFARIPIAKPRPRLKGDLVRVVASDVHGCKMHRPAVAAMLGDIKQLNPGSVMLIGDIADCGGFLAQHHVWGYVAETSYTYEDDIRAANTFLDETREAAPNSLIELVEGNHEQRVERWCITQALRGGNAKDAEYLRKQFAPEILLRLAERGIPYYRMGAFYDGLPVPGTIKRGNCFYTHGSFLTSKTAARDAVARFSGNVSFGNTHRPDIYVGRRANVGVIGGFNAGCLCELQPLWQNTNPTDWSHGYAVQFISHSGKFLHLNVPIIEGESLLVAALSTV